MSKHLYLSVALLPLLCSLAYTQEQAVVYEYAYLRLSEHGLSSKLRIQTVELGDSPEQNKREVAYQDTLSQKESLAAALQYMSEQGYELVQAMYENDISSYPELILRRRLEQDD